MSRRLRIETAGYHHIYNRGVEKKDIFLDINDKNKFLDIVCEVSETYGFIIHSYVIMDNHYHLLLENVQENLSAGMRQINATYAQYFNRKHKRVGHLWQDRFKSLYVFDENYLFILFKYLEFNPIKAKITNKFGEFEYTLSYDILHNNVKKCMEKSFVLNLFSSTSELFKSLGIEMTKEEFIKVDEFQKQSTSYKIGSKKVTKQLSVKHCFKKNLPKSERNEIILKAIKDGFTQSEIAKFLGLSNSGVSRIVKKVKNSKTQTLTPIGRDNVK